MTTNFTTAPRGAARRHSMTTNLQFGPSNHHTLLLFLLRCADTHAPNASRRGPHTGGPGGLGWRARDDRAVPLRESAIRTINVSCFHDGSACRRVLPCLSFGPLDV